MDEELKHALAGMETRLQERIQDTETKLLSVFYNWARPVESRINKQLPVSTSGSAGSKNALPCWNGKNLERGT